jgi:hypothetical protein
VVITSDVFAGSAEPAARVHADSINAVAAAVVTIRLIGASMLD